MQRCWEAKRKARKNRVRMKVRAWSHYITVHTHAHTLAHMCIHMHTWVHWCTHMLTLVYMHTHAHISTDSYTHAHTLHTYIQTCEHGQSCSYLYMYMHFWAYTCTHARLPSKISVNVSFQFFFSSNFSKGLCDEHRAKFTTQTHVHSSSGLIITQLQLCFLFTCWEQPRTSCMLYKALYHWATSPVLPTLLELKINWIWEINFLFWLKYHNI